MYLEHLFIKEGFVECPECCGLCFVDVGDPEDGVCRECPVCEGKGEVKLDD